MKISSMFLLLLTGCFDLPILEIDPRPFSDDTFMCIDASRTIVDFGEVAVGEAVPVQYVEFDLRCAVGKMVLDDPDNAFEVMGIPGQGDGAPGGDPLEDDVDTAVEFDTGGETLGNVIYFSAKAERVGDFEAVWNLYSLEDDTQVQQQIQLFVKVR